MNRIRQTNEYLCVCVSKNCYRFINFSLLKRIINNLKWKRLLPRLIKFETSSTDTLNKKTKSKDI